MKRERLAKLIRTVYGYAFIALSAVLAALFLWQIADILTIGIESGVANAAGQGAYSREVVGAHLHTIAPAIWLWLSFAVLGFVLYRVFPVTLKKSPYGDSCYYYYRLMKRLSAPPAEDEAYREIARRGRVLKIMKLVCAIFSACVAIYAIVYLALPSSFSHAGNATREVVRMVKFLLPPIAAAFLGFIAVSVYAGVTAKRLLPSLKALTAGKRETHETPNRAMRAVQRVTEHKLFLPVVRAAVLTVGVVFVIVGACTGNMAGIFQKAIYICTECIGLG